MQRRATNIVLWFTSHRVATVSIHGSILSASSGSASNLCVSTERTSIVSPVVSDELAASGTDRTCERGACLAFRLNDGKELLESRNDQNFRDQRCRAEQH